MMKIEGAGEPVIPSKMAKCDKAQASSTSRLWLERAELCLVMGASPLLLFPRADLPWIGMGLLLLSSFLRGLGSGKWIIRTPLDLPIAVILLATILGLSASFDRGLSMPKFYGILLGLFVFFATVSFISSPRRFRFALVLLVASIGVVSLLGLVGTDWHVGKYPIPTRAYSLVPRVITEVQASVGTATGFNPNELGGTLAFLLPLPLALLLRAPSNWLLKVALGLFTALGIGVLVLSASRLALAVLLLVFFVLVLWRWRRAGMATIATALIVLVVVVRLGIFDVGGFLLKLDATSTATDTSTLASRVDIWHSARYMLSDFVFTGIGLNTFPVVVNGYWPPFLEPPLLLMPHAHDVFLQTGIDLGLGGLLGFVGLSASVAWIGFQVLRRSGANGQRRGLDHEQLARLAQFRAGVVGLLWGLLSYLMFGLADTIALGAKPTVLLWLMVGLIVAAYRMTRTSGGEDSAKALTSQTRITPSRHLASFLASTAVAVYWTVALCLVALGYVVIGLETSGWMT